MSSISRTSRYIRGAFIVAKADIENLTKAVEKLIGRTPNVEVSFVGGDSLQSAGASHVLGNSLVGSRRIQKIRITGYTPTSDGAIEIDRNFTAPIFVHASGSPDDITVFNGEVKNLTDSMRTWYSTYFALSQTPVASVGSVIVFLGFAVFVLSYWLKYISYPWVGSAMLQNAVLILYAIWWVPKILPKLVFDIGASGRRARFWWKVREILFVGVFLAIVAGVAATFIYDAIS